MSCRVFFVLGKEKNVEATLEYGVKNNELVISFLDDDGEELLTDKLVYYSTISVDDSNALSLQLCGDKMIREITFLTENDSSDFWDFLQSHSKLT